MKNSFRSFCLITLLNFCAFFPAGAQEVTKTFMKAFNMSGVTHITLDLPGEIDIKTWDNETIRFEILVGLPEGNSASMLDELARVGRYNLILTAAGADGSFISAPNLKRQIKVKGQELQERITFLVYVPKNAAIDFGSNEVVAGSEKK